MISEYSFLSKILVYLLYCCYSFHSKIFNVEISFVRYAVNKSVYIAFK